MSTEVEIDKDTCIACGICYQVCPEVYEADSAGKSRLLKEHRTDNEQLGEVPDELVGCANPYSISGNWGYSMAEVKSFASIRAAVGKRSFTVPGGITVRNALDQLVEEVPKLGEEIYNKEGKLKSSLHVLVNGRHVNTWNGMETIVESDDRVVVLPLVGGG